jgi:hypothetical protein
MNSQEVLAKAAITDALAVAAAIADALAVAALGLGVGLPNANTPAPGNMPLVRWHDDEWWTARRSGMSTNSVPAMGRAGR